MLGKKVKDIHMHICILLRNKESPVPSAVRDDSVKLIFHSRYTDAIRDWYNWSTSFDT